MGKIFAFLHRIKPYASAILGIAFVCLLVLLFANDFFTQHFAWAPTRGEIVKAGIACVLIALLIVAGLFALPFAVATASVLALCIDYSFLSIFKVAWVTLTMLFAVGFFLGGPTCSKKPQWEVDRDLWEARRQAKLAQERRIRV